MGRHSVLCALLCIVGCLQLSAVATQYVVSAPPLAAAAPAPSDLTTGSVGARNLPGVERLTPGLVTAVQNISYNDVNYYFFVLQNATQDIAVELLQYQGNADLYIVEPSNPAPFADNGFDTNGWSSTTAANESIFIPRSDPFYAAGTYAIAVQGYGKGSSLYQLLVQFTSEPRVLVASEKAAVTSIYDTCCAGQSDACSGWTHAGGLMKEPCEVAGWECTPDGHMEIMDFTSFGLSCSFPWAAISNFIALETLRLNANQLYGTVDWAELAKLPNLQTLDMKNNALVGSVGCDLATAGTPFLELDVSYNAFSGPLPGCYVSKPEMRVVTLDNNTFTGDLPQTIPANSELRSVSMSGVGATGTLTADFGLPLNLMTVDLSKNNISGPIPDGIVGPYMDSLLLNNNSLTGAIPLSLTTSTQFTTLNLNRNLLTGNIDVLANAQYLVQISVNNNTLSGALPQVWNTPLLTSLNIRNNFFSGPIPTSLLTQPSLIIFTAGNNLLTGQLPDLPEGSVSQLRVVNVTSNQLTGPIPTSYSSLPVFDGTSAVQVATTGKILQQVFDASYNMLNGSVPSFFQQFSLPAWAVVDLSGNELTCTGAADTLIANVTCGVPAGVSSGGSAGPFAVKGPAASAFALPTSSPPGTTIFGTPSPSAAAASALASSTILPGGASSTEKSAGGGLSAGGIAGIAVGIILGVVVLAGLAVLGVLKLTKHQRETLRAKSFQRFASPDV